MGSMEYQEKELTTTSFDGAGYIHLEKA